MFFDPDFSFPGGESITICQNRIILIFKKILMKYKGQKVVIGTHGLVMTLMMRYFDSQYNLVFFVEDFGYKGECCPDPDHPFFEIEY